ncbi:DUF2304 domain-containing protein [Microbacterium rhizosphaerae]|uniref:DUF2304 domain-containing protein n=1 Tax=Microbacterium rhizosphaerae TaxID=1678237 RepID=A0ABZ0SPW8_9MICO|nr:DUF2304 domain-containing protein [Microbacterium rhizosphaerae]WPR90820.1 DUF2304 domain-containing protein [Microbacterium rhizosphaerae]
MIVVGGIILAAVIIVLVFWMLLTRKLREKYAALWLIIGLGVLILGLFPKLLLWLTAALGVQLPSNLIFSMAILLLLGVGLHLSWELSQAEDEIRRLAEESAIARTEIQSLKARLDALEERDLSARSDQPDDAGSDGGS